MASVTLSEFRGRQSDFIATAQREPVEITSRGARVRAVLVSPEFYRRALQALQDQADVEGRWEAVHPGEVLLEEFLQEWGVSQRRLALAIGVPPQRLNDIVHGKRRVTADTALWLARYFGTTPRFWLNLQTMFDLDREEDAVGDSLEAIRPLRSAELTPRKRDVSGSI